MTKAKHFFLDFPIKCSSILSSSLQDDKDGDREVTHMLALASGIIVVPFERLRYGGFSGDDIQHGDSADNLEEYLKENYLDSSLFADKDCWFFGQWWGESYSWEAEAAREKRQTIREYEAASGNQVVSVRQIISHLRNALSHANIYFLPFEGSQEIEHVVFLCKKKTKIGKHLIDASTRALKGYDGDDVEYLKRYIARAEREDQKCAYLMTSPESFRKFLGQWLKVVKNEVPKGTIVLNEIYGEAAD